jgi:hypothetical protein
VCTIHQPQSKIFALFDSLTILKAGDILYQVCVCVWGGGGAALPACLTPAPAGAACLGMPSALSGARWPLCLKTLRRLAPTLRCCLFAGR